MLGDIILNKEQEEAVNTFEGPVLVIAGAGAGKTKVITERIKRLIKNGVSAEKILAVTFTNKAAGEMRERVMQAGPFIGTFHALGLMLIKENTKKLDIAENFTIIDADDSVKLVKEATIEAGKDPKEFDPTRFKNQISAMKNQLITAEEFEGEGFIGEILTKIWKIYEGKKRAQNFLDFDDLLLLPTLMLVKEKDVRTRYQNRWQYIHIDEYQDTNDVQYTFSKILSAVNKNILVVGDIDQAIYSWRGADFKNVLNFQKDYPDAKIITLEKNYRSTDIILEAANALIINNHVRLPKNLWTEKKGNSPIKIIYAEDERRESEMVAIEIALLRDVSKHNISYGKIAVLYRTNAQSRAVEEVFLKKNIPYRIIGGFRFYERKEIKDILAYIKYSLNSSDEISKKRILNVPPRGIGKTLMQKIARNGGVQADLFLKPEEEKKYSNFLKLILEIKEDSLRLDLYEFLKNTIKKIKYREFIDDGTEKGNERWQNVGELMSIAKKITSSGGNINSFLEHVALFAVDDKFDVPSHGNPPVGGEKVSLMTMHTAKGLEFDAVFVVGLEEGLFPHSLSIEPAKLEEERRLCYVAITRAKTHLYLTYAARRTLFGERVANMPSRFLKEIPEHLTEYVSAPEETNEDGILENVIEY